MESNFGNFKKIGIIGVGQIGGSIGIAIKNRMKNMTIYGCDKDFEILRKAFFLDYKTDKISDLLECEILILATPILEIIKILRKIEKMKYSGIVIDTGSTKKIICDRAKNFKLKFIGGHPFTGNEKTAPEAWDGDIFENRIFFLCDVKRDEELIEFAKKFFNRLGARPFLIEPDFHDKILALTSHLPYLISLLFLKNSKEKEFEGPGFKSFTRIAHQNPKMFADIILTNRKNIKKNFKKIRKEIEFIFKINKKEKLVGVLNENKKTLKVES